MPAEITLLGATLVLGFVQIIAADVARTRQYGLSWNMGARDGEMPPLRPVVGRLLRAQANLFETLPLFAAGVLACAWAGRLGALTLVGSHLFFWGRLVYLPLYAAGLRPWRSIAWLVATAGMLLVLLALFVG